MGEKGRPKKIRTIKERITIANQTGDWRTASQLCLEFEQKNPNLEDKEKAFRVGLDSRLFRRYSAWGQILKEYPSLATITDREDFLRTAKEIRFNEFQAEPEPEKAFSIDLPDYGNNKEPSTFCEPGINYKEEEEIEIVLGKPETYPESQSRIIERKEGQIPQVMRVSEVQARIIKENLKKEKEEKLKEIMEIYDKSHGIKRSSN